MIRYYHLTEQGLGSPIDLSTIHDTDTKFVFFLGGILHLNGQYIGPGLGNLLYAMCADARREFQICTVTLSDTPVSNELVNDMHELARHNHILPYMETLTRELLFPAHRMAIWNTLPHLALQQELTRHFQRFIFLGYSFGTSLIQQLELISRQIFCANQFPLTPLASAHGLNIGPCLCPRLWMADSNETVNVGRSGSFSSPAREYDSDVFTQAFFIRANDKFMQDVIGKELIPTQSMGDFPSRYQINRKTFVIENACNAMAVKLQLFPLPSGQTIGQIDYRNDPSGHELTTYCSTKELIISAERQIATYPSSSLAGPIRETLCSMIDGTYHDQTLSTKAISSSHQVFTAYQTEFTTLYANYCDADLQQATKLTLDEMERLHPIGLSNQYLNEHVISEAVSGLFNCRKKSEDCEVSEITTKQGLQRLMSQISLEDLKTDICTEVFDQHIVPERVGIWKQTLLTLNEFQRFAPEDIFPWSLQNSFSLRDIYDLLDLEINQIVVKHLMKSLQTIYSEKMIHIDDAKLMCDYVLGNFSTRIDQKTLQSLLEMAAGFSASPEPLIYFSLGCGNGQADVKYVHKLSEALPHKQILVAGMDTYRGKMGHVFEYAFDGIIIPPPSGTESVSYPALVRAAFDCSTADVLLVERFAFHHFGMTCRQLKHLLDNCPLLSVEEPVTAPERAQLLPRVARIAYDLLINWALDMMGDQNWIIPAITSPAPQTSQFQVLYRWAEHLPGEGTQVEGVYPRTDVIKYHPFQY
ncbi:hypothetical protein [Hahella sp. CCB-MM4]|uniref:hypothetical protein n=1 Tax=Hahella sp. (strain CCB-MM4) TaxID=1926491 RepID=UPI0011408BF8|nr:hypothetical protein [Hahella sp. CCB-MM4]